MGKVENYVRQAVAIANDDSHGYSQFNRDANPDFDCSSLVCYVVEQAGINIHDASYTGNMYSNFKRGGFKDVTDQIDLDSGAGLKRGDVLLNRSSHTEIYIGDGMNVGAHCDENGSIEGWQSGDQTGNEISTGPYYNFPWTDVLRYPEDSSSSNPSPTQSIAEIAQQVINGEWGNGDDRRAALESAGYNYNEVQAKVNAILSGDNNSSQLNFVAVPDPNYDHDTDILHTAQDVIDGIYGNGDDRKTLLESLGYDYNEVQSKVNELLGFTSSSAKSGSGRKSIDELADEVINGDWGNGLERKQRLQAAGYSYKKVQQRVNEILK